jgi:hypothetical protein
MPSPELHEPWRTFLMRCDAACQMPVEFHCLGGFVVTQRYGLMRSTRDFDVLSVRPKGASQPLLELAGRDSALHRELGVYLDVVTIANVPEDYDQRLSEMYAGAFKHLRIFALDAYDLALAKLERNIYRDRADVMYLARTVPFDLALLRERYEKELRPYLGNPEREDLTLRLWIEAIQEDRSGK